MKLKYQFELVDVGEEKIAVPIGKNSHKLNGVIKLNQEGAEILQLLNRETTIEAIVSELHKKYDNDVAELTRYVTQMVLELQRLGFIDD